MSEVEILRDIASLVRLGTEILPLIREYLETLAKKEKKLAQIYVTAFFRTPVKINLIDDTLAKLRICRDETRRPCLTRSGKGYIVATWYTSPETIPDSELLREIFGVEIEAPEVDRDYSNDVTLLLIPLSAKEKDVVDAVREFVQITSNELGADSWAGKIEIHYIDQDRALKAAAKLQEYAARRQLDLKIYRHQSIVVVDLPPHIANREEVYGEVLNQT